MTDSTHKPTPATPCPEREEALALHVGSDLPADEARELDDHLADCTGCRTFLAELAADRRALKAVGATSPAAEPVAEVHRRVMSEVEIRSERPRSPSTWRWAAAAALLLAVATALLLQLRPEHSSPDPGTSGEEPTILAEAPPGEDERGRLPRPTPAPTRGMSSSPETAGPQPETPSEVPVPDAVPDSTPAIPPETPSDNRRARRDERPDLKIQLVSDDPDVVIYWLVDPEEPADAASTTSST